MIDAFREGATPETIVRWFDSLQLADVYAVISHYLRHKEKVEEYLRGREELAAQVRSTIEEGRPARPNLRDELLARRRTEQSEAGENQDKAKEKPRRHLLGLPPGYTFDPNAKPTLDDLSGIPVCFGDDDRLRPGDGHTESDGASAGG